MRKLMYNEWLDHEMMTDLEPEDVMKCGCLTALCSVVMFAVMLILLVLFGSCSSSKILTTERDSVSVKVRTETIYVPDTVYVEIPAQSAERTTTDSVSHLETDYASSDARIEPDGSLFHSLANKPQQKPVDFQKPVIYKDSIVYRDKVQTVTKTVEVEKKLSRWDKFKMDYGLAAVVATMLILLYSLYRFIRR